MDPRFATQQGIYEVLEQADGLPGMLDIRIGDWLAWPAAKTYVYSRFFAALLDSGAPAAEAASPGWRALLQGRDIALSYLRLRHALAALPAKHGRARAAWLVATFPSRGPDGIVRDAIFDELPLGLQEHCEQVWLAPPVMPPAGIDARRVFALAEDLAGRIEPFQKRRAGVRTAAAAMASRLELAAPRRGGVPWDSILRGALASFESRRLAWRRVFRLLRPDLLLVTDGAYRAGEIAAAKAAGVRVAEHQHGLFGPRCPEYGWPGVLSASMERMPVADTLLVFGNLFREGALKNGFWPAARVKVTGSVSLERHRAAAAAPPAHGARRPRLLFFTQVTSREDALRFWGDFLDGVVQGRHPDCVVTIKLHPAESAHAHEYASLAARFARNCVVAAADADPLQLILESDLVASYTSNALVEAAGLGRAAVSLAGRHVPGGIFALCPVPGAADTIPLAATPAALAALLPAGAPAANRGFYADGGAAAALAACRELLEGAARRIT